MSVCGGIFDPTADVEVQLPGHFHLVPHGQVRAKAQKGDFEISVRSDDGSVYKYIHTL